MFHVHSPKHSPYPGRILPLQRTCHARWSRFLLGFAVFTGCIAPACAEPPKNNYPTQARVEYVNECITRNGGKLSRLYQCSCVIDDIANRLTYDEFVEAATFDRYSTLPGEGGGIFRDPEQGKARAKQLREIEKNAYLTCGLGA